MDKSMLRLTLFSFVLFVLAFGLQYLKLEWVHPYLIWMVVFYWLQFVLMGLLSGFLKKSVEVEEVFILLGGVTARLLVAMMVMVIVAIVRIDQTKLFIINFVVLYLHYLVFEIKGVLSNLRSNLN